MIYVITDRPTSAGERVPGEEDYLETSNMESDFSESPPSSPGEHNYNFI